MEEAEGGEESLGMALVYIPPLMRPLTGGVDKVTVQGASIRQVINNLEIMFPGIKDRLVEDDRLMPGISVAVDGDFVRLGLMEPVRDTSEVHFLPAISGGSRQYVNGHRVEECSTRWPASWVSRRPVWKD